MIAVNLAVLLVLSSERLENVELQEGDLFHLDQQQPQFDMLLLLSYICSFFLVIQAFQPILQRVARVKSRYVSMVSYTFLEQSTNQPAYYKAILSSSVDSAKLCIANEVPLIEIAFPEDRKSDISVSESLDINRVFARDFINNFKQFGDKAWLILPDKKESFLAKSKFDKESSFTVTSIESAVTMLSSNNAGDEKSSPQIMVAVNPGFNVEEWIALAALQKCSRFTCPLVVVNGNLDRLRNGYYPRFFYPKLYQVTQSFYQKFETAFNIRPIALGGDRYGAWIVKSYPNKWLLLVKNTSGGGYSLKGSYEKEPDPTKVWSEAKKLYLDARGSMF